MPATRTLGAAAAALFLASTAPAVADVTLINVLEVPEGQLAQTVTAWEEARDFLSEEPGYIATALHQSLAADARFALINVARWDSAEAFHAAIRRMRAAGIYPDIEGLGVNPALYRVIRADGAAQQEADR